MSATKMKFRLLAGCHSEADPTQVYPNPNNVNELPRSILYRAGENDIIETDKDLVAMFNSRISKKFERLPNDYVEQRRDFSSPTPASEQMEHRENWNAESLSTFNVKELKALAKEESISIGNAEKKEDIIAAILQAMPLGV